MDKDDFEQWRESPVTQWFMALMEEKAVIIKDEIMAQVWGSVISPDWAASQSGLAWKKGAAEALLAVTVYSFDDLEDKEVPNGR